MDPGIESVFPWEKNRTTKIIAVISVIFLTLIILTLLIYIVYIRNVWVEPSKIPTRSGSLGVEPNKKGTILNDCGIKKNEKCQISNITSLKDAEDYCIRENCSGFSYDGGSGVVELINLNEDLSDDSNFSTYYRRL